MNKDVIQSKIRLVALRAVSVNFSLIPKEREHEEVNDFQIGLKDIRFAATPHLFAKLFKIDIASSSNEETEIIKISLEYQALFESGDVIDDEFMNSDFVKVSASAIGFPYVRAFISNLTVQAGFPQIILPSINFLEYNKNAEQEEENKKEVK